MAADSRVRCPDATVARLATYLRVVASFEERGVETVSSEELAVAAGVNSAKLRKDLSHLGSYGVRGVGYSVDRPRPPSWPARWACASTTASR